MGWWRDEQHSDDGLIEWASLHQSSYLRFKTIL